MSDDLYIWVTRWPDFQHYKPNPDRGPAWIKAHTAQLNDVRYLSLNNRERALLHDLRMLFASMRARLPHDRSMIGALRNAETRQTDLDSLNHAGLIEVVSRATLEQRLDKFYSRSRAEVEVDLEVEKDKDPSFLPSPTQDRGRKEGTENGRIKPKTEAELVAEHEIAIPSAFHDMPL